MATTELISILSALLEKYKSDPVDDVIDAATFIYS